MFSCLHLYKQKEKKLFFSTAQNQLRKPSYAYTRVQLYGYVYDIHRIHMKLHTHRVVEDFQLELFKNRQIPGKGKRFASASNP